MKNIRLFLVSPLAVVLCFLAASAFGILERATWFWFSGTFIYDPALKNIAHVQPMFLQQFISICFFVYGVHRATTFSPLLKTSFQTWLKNQPWTANDTVPFLPRYLSFPDLFLVLLTIPVSLIYPVNPLPIAITAAGFLLAGFVFGVAFMLRLWKKTAAAYALFYGMLLIPLLNLWPILPSEFPGGLLIAFALYIVSERARRSVYPNFLEQSIKPPTPTLDRTAWWPVPLPAQVHIPLADSILLSIALGFLSFYYHHMALLADPRRGIEDFGNMLAMFAVIATLLRLAIYCLPYRPPISILGRLATGRLIIPRYDQAFIAPILTILIPGLAQEFLPRAGLSLNLSYSITFGLVFLLATGLGPTLTTWQLTGQHRMVNLTPKTKAAPAQPNLKIE